MTQVEAAPDASARGARADRGRLVQLILAAVLMGATGVMLVVTGLAINVDVHALVAGILLNVWFVITLSAAAGTLPGSAPTRGTRHWPG